MPPEQADPVNTPNWLGGAALSLWIAKLQVQRYLLIMSGVALLVLVTLQVFTRYVMGISVLGIEELACFSAVWSYFLGSSLGAWERGHISAGFVELVSRNSTIISATKMIASILTVVIAAWVTVWAWQYFAFSLLRGSTSPDTGIQLAWVHLIMPICLSLMTLYWLVEAGDAISRFISRERSK